MADKGAKKKAKPKRQKAAAEPSVLGSLPAHRPQRLGGRGRAPARAPQQPAPAAAAPARPEPASATPTPQQPATGTPAPRAQAQRPRTTRRPAAVSAAARPLDRRPRPATPPPRPPPRRTSAPRGTELVTTAIQAAGELAQIGLTVGGQVLKRAVDRLPKP